MKFYIVYWRDKVKRLRRHLYVSANTPYEAYQRAEKLIPDSGVITAVYEENKMQNYEVTFIINDQQQISVYVYAFDEDHAVKMAEFEAMFKDNNFQYKYAKVVKL